VCLRRGYQLNEISNPIRTRPTNNPLPRGLFLLATRGRAKKRTPPARKTGTLFARFSATNGST
jgi:hypothetical protein